MALGPNHIPSLRDPQPPRRQQPIDAPGPQRADRKKKSPGRPGLVGGRRGAAYGVRMAVARSWANLPMLTRYSIPDLMLVSLRSTSWA